MDYIYKVLESDMELLAAALSEVQVSVVLKDGTEEVLEPGDRSEHTQRNLSGSVDYRIAGMHMNSECFRLSLGRLPAPCLEALVLLIQRE